MNLIYLESIRMKGGIYIYSSSQAQGDADIIFQKHIFKGLGRNNRDVLSSSLAVLLESEMKKGF